MKKENTNFTFELVKSLGKREKIFFRRFANLSNQKDKSYLKLYDYLLRQSEFNRDKLLKHFKDEPFVQHLSSAFLYLEEQILTSLVNYHFFSRKGTQLPKLLAHVNTLIIKGFSKKGARLIKKAKKEAYAREEFALILRLTELEEEILFNHGILKFTQELQRLQEERERIIQLMTNYTGIRLMKEELREIVYSEERFLSPKQMEKYPILSNPLLQDESAALSTKAKVYWHYNVGLLSYIKRDFAKGLHHFQEELKLLHQHQREFPELLTHQCLSNVMYLSSFISEHTAFNSAKEELNELFSDGKVEYAYYHYILYCRSLAFHIRCEDHEELRKMLDLCKPFVEQEPAPLGVLEMGILLELMIQATIECEDFALGAKFVHLWNTHCNLSTQYRVIKPMSLIIYFELKYFDLLESTLRSAERINLAPNMNSKFEQALLRFFDQSLKSPEHKSVLSHARILEKEVDLIANDVEENVMLSSFEFRTWISRLPNRISNRSKK